MDFQSLDQYCRECGGWFDKRSRHIKHELVETPNGNISEIHFCPNCAPGTELKDAAEYGIQTPYQREICKIIAGEISMHESRIHDLTDRIRRHGGET